MKKTEALEKLISKLEISESELANWFYNRNHTNFIPTKLPLVYCHNNKLIVRQGLDLNHKKELWGIQLSSGVMVSLTCWEKNQDMIDAILHGPINPRLTWKRAKKIVNTMQFNGKKGRLPSRCIFKKGWDGLDETSGILEENNIEAVGGFGFVWCTEEKGTTEAYLFDLESWGDDAIDKTCVQYGMRLAVVFD